MGFEFEYGRPDSKPAPPQRPPRRPGPQGLRQRIADLWRRTPRAGRITVAVVLVLAASTIITSRDRGSDATLDEIAAASPPAADANPAPATSLQATTLPPSAEPEPPPETTAAATLPPASPTVTAAVSDTRPEPPPSTAAAPEPTAAPPSSAVDWSELALSVVYVQAARCPSLPSSLSNSGSGTVVRGGAYVLTNAHVVHDDNGAPCRELAVWFTRSFEEEPDDWVRAALVAADRRLDLAVLQLEAPVSADRSIRIAAQQLKPGESIRILGYPGAGGLTMTLTRGSYSGMIDHEGEAYIKTDADISEGNSGGAAFDEAGVFVGVPTAGIEQVGLLVPAGVAEQFLNRALES